MKVFYVCSWGGCGSTMLFKYLENFGKAYHVHSRFPPYVLTYIGDKASPWYDHDEQFSNKPITDEDYSKNTYYIIYIYRNPIKSIYSRFTPGNLKNIGLPPITINQVARQKTDLYRIREFYENYTKPKQERNYKVICVKYEELFERFEEFNEVLGIPNKPELYPIKKERNLTDGNLPVLEELYADINKEMSEMPFIKIV